MNSDPVAIATWYVELTQDLAMSKLGVDEAKILGTPIGIARWSDSPPGKLAGLKDPTSW